jgi:hypothetical protein
MKKISTVQAFSNEILKEQRLTIGLDLRDRWSFYCVLRKKKVKVCLTSTGLLMEGLASKA